MRLLVVYNTHAAHGRSEKLLPEVQRLAGEAGLDLDLQITTEPRHGIEIVGTADFNTYDGIIAAGGDGTLFETVNGYFQNPDAGRIPLGVIPVGTGNAFARDLDLQTGQCAEAIALIAKNQRRRIDVGRFRADCGEYYFLNILGLGFVSDVTVTAAKLKALGNVAYTLGVLYRTTFLSTHQLTIEVDGRKIERENIFMEISNTRYTADFLMAPDASIEDGLLDITLLGKITRRRLLRLFPTVFKGEHVQYEEVETFTAKHLKITAETPKILAPDGELLGTTPLEVDCLHRELEFFA